MTRHTASALVASIVLLASAAGSGVASAQTGGDGGRISGEVVFGTEGATIDPAALAVDFIVLVESDVEGSQPAMEDGVAFSLDVPLDASRRYVPRVVYRGVTYLGPPVVVTEEQPEVTAEVPVVYETTTESPDLSIAQSVMTAVALDRGTGELGLIREDFVLNPTDRVYVGGESGTTLRLPTPENVVDASGQNADGEFTFEGGVMTTTTPIRPQGGTSILTRYLVSYDVADDEYELRLTTPVAAGRLAIRVPEAYVRNLEVVAPGAEGDRAELEADDGTMVPLRTFVLEDAQPGDSLVVHLDGLALETNSNPLTETPGSIVAGIVAVAVVGTAGALAIIRGRSSGQGTA